MDIDSEVLTPEEKRIQLYLSQKNLLKTFLGTNAITVEQYRKSLGDLTEKMGMQKYAAEKKAKNGAKKNGTEETETQAS